MGAHWSKGRLPGDTRAVTRLEGEFGKQRGILPCDMIVQNLMESLAIRLDAHGLVGSRFGTGSLRNGSTFIRLFFLGLGWLCRRSGRAWRYRMRGLLFLGRFAWCLGLLRCRFIWLGRIRDLSHDILSDIVGENTNSRISRFLGLQALLPTWTRILVLVHKKPAATVCRSTQCPFFDFRTKPLSFRWLKGRRLRRLSQERIAFHTSNQRA